MSFSLTLGVKWPRSGPNEHKWSEIGSTVCSKQNSVVIGANKRPYDTLLRHTGRQSFLPWRYIKRDHNFSDVVMVPLFFTVAEPCFLRIWGGLTIFTASYGYRKINHTLHSEAVYLKVSITSNIMGILKADRAIFMWPWNENAQT